MPVTVALKDTVLVYDGELDDESNNERELDDVFDGLVVAVLVKLRLGVLDDLIDTDFDRLRDGEFDRLIVGEIEKLAVGVILV